MSTFTHHVHRHTDAHDVDEDLRTVPAYGGRWLGGKEDGVFVKTMDTTSTKTSANVASMCRHL